MRLFHINKVEGIYTWMAACNTNGIFTLQAWLMTNITSDISLDFTPLTFDTIVNKIWIISLTKKFFRCCYAWQFIKFKKNTIFSRRNINFWYFLYSLSSTWQFFSLSISQQSKTFNNIDPNLNDNCLSTHYNHPRKSADDLRNHLKQRS